MGNFRYLPFFLCWNRTLHPPHIFFQEFSKFPNSRITHKADMLTFNPLQCHYFFFSNYDYVLKKEFIIPCQKKKSFF